MTMRLKDILFGFGLGMVFLSAVFLLAYRFESWRGQGVYEERAVEMAAQLGMVWPTEDAAEIVRQALDMGMVFENEERMPYAAEY
jgi:hypothetical protein